MTGKDDSVQNLRKNVQDLTDRMNATWERIQVAKLLFNVGTIVEAVLLLEILQAINDMI